MQRTSFVSAAGGYANLAGITNMQEVGGTRSISVWANGSAAVNLGIDLETPATPTPLRCTCSMIAVASARER